MHAFLSLLSPFITTHTLRVCVLYFHCISEYSTGALRAPVVIRIYILSFLSSSSLRHTHTQCVCYTFISCRNVPHVPCGHPCTHREREILSLSHPLHLPPIRRGVCIHSGVQTGVLREREVKMDTQRCAERERKKEKNVNIWMWREMEMFSNIWEVYTSAQRIWRERERERKKEVSYTAKYSR